MFFSNTSVVIIKFAGERTLKNANLGLDWQRNLAGTRQDSERSSRQFRPGCHESVESHNNTNTLVISITETRAPTFLDELPVLNSELCTRENMQLF